MTNSPRSSKFSFNRFFFGLLALTLLIYLLRGFGVLTFLPGGILLGLMVLCVITGIGVSVAKTRRF